MSIESVEVLYDIAVVVRVADSDASVIVNSDIGVTVSDIKFLDTSVGINTPMQGSVFFRDRDDASDMGNEIEVVQTVSDD